MRYLSVSAPPRDLLLIDANGRSTDPITEGRKSIAPTRCLIGVLRRTGGAGWGDFGFSLFLEEARRNGIDRGRNSVTLHSQEILLCRPN